MRKRKNRSKENKKIREKEGREESSLGSSTHFRAVQFSMFKCISAVCNLNHSNRRDKNYFCIYLSSVLIFKEQHVLCT